MAAFQIVWEHAVSKCLALLTSHSVIKIRMCWTCSLKEDHSCKVRHTIVLRAEPLIVSVFTSII